MMSSTVMTPSPNAPSSCSTSSAKPSESMPRSISEASRPSSFAGLPRMMPQMDWTVDEAGAG